MTRLLLLPLAFLFLGCSPARKDSNDYAPTGSWPGLSPSTPREKPSKKREPRRYGRRAIALTELSSPQKP